MNEKATRCGFAAIIALQAVIYTYDGWSAVIYFSEEVKDHGRNIPRSMLSGVVCSNRKAAFVRLRCKY